MTGRISFIKADRTFGFLKTREGEDLFIGERQSPDFDILAAGQIVRFEIAAGHGRRRAINRHADREAVAYMVHDPTSSHAFGASTRATRNEVVMIRTPNAHIEMRDTISGIVGADGLSVQLEDGKTFKIDRAWLTTPEGDAFELRPGDYVTLKRVR